MKFFSIFKIVHHFIEDLGFTVWCLSLCTRNIKSTDYDLSFYKFVAKAA